ncbi:hypothetical protein Tco_0594066 [Tanacetum coccineum]
MPTEMEHTEQTQKVFSYQSSGKHLKGLKNEKEMKLKDGGEDTRLSRSDEVLKLKNFKKDATLKLSKSSNQEKEERLDQFVDQLADRMNDMMNPRRRGERNGQRSEGEESENLFFEGDGSSSDEQPDRPRTLFVEPII